MKAMDTLVMAKTASQTTRAGRGLAQVLGLDGSSSQSNSNSTPLYSPQVLERVAKAAAMTGLTHLALQIVAQRLLPNRRVPSIMCQDAIASALRKKGKLKQLEQFLLEVGGVAVKVQHTDGEATSRIRNTHPTLSTATPSTTIPTSNSNSGVSQYAYNIYLAALCDPLLDANYYNRNQFWAPVNATALLEKAVAWLNTTHTQNCLGLLRPDAVSYATVLQAATQAGRTGLADEIWEQAVVESKARTNGQESPSWWTSQLYNARLKSFLRHGNNNNSGDAKALALWKQIASSSSVKPDRYTLDLMLLPLLRAGRIGEMEQILDRFIAHNSDQVVSDSLEAFLYTLVFPGEDVAAARAIFDLYIAPSLAPVIHFSTTTTSSSSSGNTYDNNAYNTQGPTAATSQSLRHMVRPRTRHFTILMEGYKQQLNAATAVISQQQQKQQIKRREKKIWQAETTSIAPISRSVSNNQTETGFETLGAMPPDVLREDAWKLYDLMRQSPKTQPDSYAITTMMGICRSSTEITDLLSDAIHEFGLNCTSVVLRAAMTAYGEVGDASSACHLYATFMTPKESKSSMTRYWNVLLGAIVKGHRKKSRQSFLQVANADSKRILETGDGAFPMNDVQGNELIQQLDGLASWEAAHMIVHKYVREPNSQTFCLLAQAAQTKPVDANLALEIFRNASLAGVPTDGRFANAVIRCFGPDIDAAVDAWKNQIRPACDKYERRERKKPISPTRSKGKNLLAAYHALFYVCGRAVRPDIAVRLVYAMSKEGLEPDETALNCYEAGKRIKTETLTGTKMREKLKKLVNMASAYESLLYVECVKYDKRDKRRAGEKSIRIIL